MVTAVFADIKRSTEPMETSTQKRHRAIVDPALKLMIDAVRDTLEHARAIANHESLRTTRLYDRTREELSFKEVERIKI